MKMISNTIFNTKNVVYYSNQLVSKLKKIADKSKRKRSRICIHKSRKAKTHEMIIALKEGSYIQPHIHLNKKSESYHIIEGKMLVYIFSRKGKLINKIKMGNFNSKLNFYYRMNKSYFHMPIAISKYCIYHETFSGPFNKKNDVMYAKFAPKEENKLLVIKFLKKIKFLKR
tara:strand:+ start:388 stop:900 length:513 start_codon:yes stop_codon:yes gene_type:complete